MLGKGRIPWGNDFTANYADMVWGTGTLVTGGFGGGIGFASVNEGSFAAVVDEPGGILDILTDTGDNDNAVLFAGPFRPSDGNMWCQARFKHINLDDAIFIGFTETLALDTPVMPAEFATATMTYNGTGGMVGLQYDVDGTTDDFRACMGDGAAAISDSSNGIRSNTDVTVDQWLEAHVSLNADGSARCYMGSVATANKAGEVQLKLVKDFRTGTLLSTSALYYAVFMIENRSGNARHVEVDFFEGEAGRAWRYTTT